MNSEPPGSVVLDSSVVIKWFRRYEVPQEQALELRQAYLDGHLFIHVPDLLIYEIARATWRLPFSLSLCPPFSLSHLILSSTKQNLLPFWAR